MSVRKPPFPPEIYNRCTHTITEQLQPEAEWLAVRQKSMELDRWADTSPKMDLDQQKGLRKENPQDNLEFVSGYGTPPFFRAGSPSSMIVTCNFGIPEGALSEAGT